MTARAALVDRLADKFVFSPDGCWLWTAANWREGVVAASRVVVSA